MAVTWRAALLVFVDEIVEQRLETIFQPDQLPGGALMFLRREWRFETKIEKISNQIHLDFIFDD